MMKLLNPCKYSFRDLIKASGKPPEYHDFLMRISQEERNKCVKELCHDADWYCQDVVGADNIVYTAFSPFLVNEIGHVFSSYVNK